MTKDGYAAIQDELELSDAEMAQSHVAAELGVTTQAVSKWMRCRIG
jgi:predicted transcriptional regulator